jgi:hypothetical protein
MAGVGGRFSSNKIHTCIFFSLETKLKSGIFKSTVIISVLKLCSSFTSFGMACIQNLLG